MSRGRSHQHRPPSPDYLLGEIQEPYDRTTGPWAPVLKEVLEAEP